MSSTQKPVIGYWPIRGFVQHIRLLLKYVGSDYEDKIYPFGEAPGFNRESWTVEKFQHGLDFPNLPYWIDKDVRITESKAIFKYVATIMGQDLLPATPQLQAVADMLDGYLNDLQKVLLDYSYAPADKQPPIPEESCSPKFEQLTNFLQPKKWALGKTISYIDFFLYEVLYQFRKYREDIFSSYPVLEGYLRAFEALPELTDYIKSTSHLTCYSPHATVKF